MNGKSYHFLNPPPPSFYAASDIVDVVFLPLFLKNEWWLCHVGVLLSLLPVACLISHTDPGPGVPRCQACAKTGCVGVLLCSARLFLFFFFLKQRQEVPLSLFLAETTLRHWGARSI